MAGVPIASDGLVLLYTAIVALALTWPVFIARIAVRIWRAALGLDDWLMAGGIVLSSVFTAVNIYCCYYGAGQYSAVLDAETISIGTRAFFFAEFVYATSCALIKASVAVTLLRINNSRKLYSWIVYIVMGLTFAATIIFCVGVAKICDPVYRIWDHTAEGTCNLQLDTDVSIFFSAVEILTDAVLAILPAFMLWNVQMKRSLKIAIGGILALATFASIATIIRLGYLNLYSNPQEFMYGVGKIGLWSIVEEGVGIIAACVPPLRPVLRLRFIRMLGFTSYGSNNQTSGTGGGGRSRSKSGGMGGSKSRGFNGRIIASKRAPRSHFAMDTFLELDEVERGSVCSRDGQGSRECSKVGSDGESQTRIIVKTDIAVAPPGAETMPVGTMVVYSPSRASDKSPGWRANSEKRLHSGDKTSGWNAV